jgi:predicted DNA-binding transcriptional regulator AlpA
VIRSGERPDVPLLAAVPTLDQLAAEPARAAHLSAEVRRALTLQAVAVIGCLAVAETTDAGHGRTRLEPELTDRLLTPAEAAERLGVTPTWMYRHARTLPFTRRLSRKVLRFSESGLRRWQAARLS